MAATPRTAAVVGAAGGVGATRLTVELGATLARAGRDVVVLDAAFATQGLARYARGRVDPDLTDLVLARADGEERPLADALVEPTIEGTLAGSLALCPVRAPFERVARAGSPAAARAFETLLADAAAGADHALVDVAPIAGNQAVAAATTADRIALVTRPDPGGIDALQRARGLLADVGTAADLVVANRAAEAPADATHAVPDSETTAEVPACLDARTPFAPAVAAVAADLFDVEPSLSFERDLLGTARRRLG